MDLLRAAAKCLFYDMKMDDALDIVEKIDACNAIHDKLVEILQTLLEEREPRYSSEAIRSLMPFIESEWMNAGKYQARRMPWYGRVLALLEYFTDKVLAGKDGLPIVVFDHLLQWKDMSLFIGEDVLISSWMAQQQNVRLDWGIPLEHDCTELNGVLNGDLYDNHSHLNGCLDNADLSWVYAMNHLENGCLWDKIWTCRAAAIRLNLYKVMNNTTEVASAVDSIKKAMAINAETVDEYLGNLASDLAEQQDNYGCLYYGKQKEKWDYAAEDVNESPFVLLYGERKIIVNALRWVYRKQQADYPLFGYVYMYILIKSWHRREYVQSNMRIGLTNYNAYYHKVDDEVVKWMPNDVQLKYSIQTSVRQNKGDHVELRLSNGKLKYMEEENGLRPIASSELEEYKDANALPVTLIVNINKEDSTQGDHRFSKTRETFAKEINSFLKNVRYYNGIYLNEENINHDKIMPISGLDISSTDLKVHPGVASPYLRYVRLKGVKNDIGFVSAEQI